MREVVIISDTSTLIGLSNLNCIDLLRQIYKRVIVTSIVADEFGQTIPDWVTVRDDYDKGVYRALIPILDRGEASAIALSLHLQPSILIIDEKKGRKQAKQLGISVTGLVGVLVKAKQMGLIENGRAKLEELQESGFRLSDRIFSLALREMGE